MLARILVTIAGSVAVGAYAAADDVMRCGAVIVDIGMVTSQVVAKCGEPQSKEIDSAPVKRKSSRGGVNTVGGTRIERWTYDRGYGQPSALLTFDQGKLKSIEFLRH